MHKCVSRAQASTGGSRVTSRACELDAADNGEAQPAHGGQPVVMAETLVDITALNRSSHPATLFYVADVEGSEPVPYATLEPNGANLSRALPATAGD